MDLTTTVVLLPSQFIRRTAKLAMELLDLYVNVSINNMKIDKKTVIKYISIHYSRNHAHYYYTYLKDLKIVNEYRLNSITNKKRSLNPYVSIDSDAVKKFRRQVDSMDGKVPTHEEMAWDEKVVG